MKKWIIPSSLKQFDVIGAFNQFDEIEWTQKSENISIGDLVFIYVGAPISSVKYCCKVTAIHLESDDTIDGDKYVLKGDYLTDHSTFMRIKKLLKYEDDVLPMSLLREYGVKGNIQSIRTVPVELDNYLGENELLPILGLNKIIMHLKVAEELVPDEYDGSYELMSETVRAYSHLDNLSEIDYQDLNLVYHMSIGTWKHSIDKKKKSIGDSHLKSENKDELIAILEKVWKRAKNGEYQNREGDGSVPSVGMFGTGFYSFKTKTNDESAKRFIEMCVGIQNMDDDKQIFDRAEKVFSNGFNGMKAAAASQVLHCLKPFTFPILNSNMGYQNIFEALGVKLVKKADIETYIDNCRRIKEYRDHNYSFKNYRVFDVAAWMLEKTEQGDSNTYWPSLAEYDPGISKDDYKKCMMDPSVVRYSSLDTVYRIYQMGGEATCKQVASDYGNTANHYNLNAQHVAKWVSEATGCPLREDETGKHYWQVLFVGRDAEATEKGVWIWKLREPLEKAIAELDQEGFFDEMEDNNIMANKFDKNMILYGPPGTGKTYNSIIYAVAICDHREFEDVQNEKYSDVLDRYKELRKEGRISFTTFHQSYGYEEFIEGIKPVVDEENDSADLRYVIDDGVFKRFCKKAEEVEVTSPSLDIRPDATIWKIIIASGTKNNVKDECFSEGNMRIGFDLKKDAKDASVREFVEDMMPGDIVLSFKTRETIDGIGIIDEGEPDYLPDKSEYQAYRPVKWIATDIDENILDINNGKLLHRMTVSRVPQMAVEDILAVAAKYNNALNDTKIKTNTKPYVFIIDEINRGNISKIFGELITLIEPTKRKGAAEEMAAVLPYSKVSFRVPDNVYIIGTMNTADRSIALMDTALRRRFAFIEMMPESSVLSSINADRVESSGEILDIVSMLDKINERIEYLYDREHTIGHAFFTGLADDPTIEKLADIFLKKVIPLLQEYFYEDYSKIQLVLGDNGKDNENYKFIKDSRIVLKDLFNGNPDIDLGEIKYEINQSAFLEIQSYLQI